MALVKAHEVQKELYSAVEQINTILARIDKEVKALQDSETKPVKKVNK